MTPTGSPSAEGPGGEVAEPGRCRVRIGVAAAPDDNQGDGHESGHSAARAGCLAGSDRRAQCPHMHVGLLLVQCLDARSRDRPGPPGSLGIWMWITLNRPSSDVRTMAHVASPARPDTRSRDGPVVPPQ